MKIEAAWRLGLTQAAWKNKLQVWGKKTGV
jgi:hypothetical protein